MRRNRFGQASMGDDIYERFKILDALREEQANSTPAILRDNGYFATKDLHCGDLIVKTTTILETVIKHSCSPNATISRQLSTSSEQPNTFSLYALANIEDGEEIRICYNDGGEGPWQVSKDRKKDLSLWQLECSCEVCASPEREETRRDIRSTRRLLRTLDRELERYLRGKPLFVMTNLYYDRVHCQSELVRNMYADLAIDDRSYDAEADLWSHLIHIPPKVSPRLIEEYEYAAKVHLEEYYVWWQDPNRTRELSREQRLRVSSWRFYEMALEVIDICHGPGSALRKEKEVVYHEALLGLNWHGSPPTRELLWAPIKDLPSWNVAKVVEHAAERAIAESEHTMSTAATDWAQTFPESSQNGEPDTAFSPPPLGPEFDEILH